MERMLIFQRFFGTLQTGRNSVNSMSAKYMPQNTEMIIAEMLTKYQLRGYNKNQSLILSPLASANFISVGEGFPLTWMKISALLTFHHP